MTPKNPRPPICVYHQPPGSASYLRTGDCNTVGLTTAYVTGSGAAYKRGVVFWTEPGNYKFNSTATSGARCIYNPNGALYATFETSTNQHLSGVSVYVYRDTC